MHHRHFMAVGDPLLMSMPLHHTIVAGVCFGAAYAVGCALGMIALKKLNWARGVSDD